MRTFVLPRGNGTRTGGIPATFTEAPGSRPRSSSARSMQTGSGRLERDFVSASQLETDREAGRQRIQNRRLRALLVAGAVLLVLTVVAGVVAVVGQQRASKNAQLADAAARAALGRQLGAEALGEQRLDVAALLAREGVVLDRSPQTEGTLLTTLLRSPAVLGTFPLPTDSTPHVAVSPDGRTLAVSDSVADSVQFYDARTRALEPRRLRDFAGDQSPVYSADGSLLVYTSGGSLVVRDARTLALRERLVLGPPYRQELAADIPEGSTLIAPDGRTVYYAYWLMDAAGQPAQAYLASSALSSGQPLRTIRLGSGPLLTVRLLDRGTRLAVVTAHDVTTYDASTLRPLRTLMIRPTSLLPAAAAISPDARTIAIGSQDGSVSFVDADTGGLRRAQGGQHSAAVAAAVYSPNGRTVMTVGDDGRVIVWDPRSGRRLMALPGPAGHVQDAQVSPDGSTLYTAGTGGVMLAWDLTGERGFGRSARLSASLQCCDSVTPEAPAFALSPDGTELAVAAGDSKVGVYSTTTLRREKSFAIGSTANRVTALSWSPTGKTLAVGAHGGIVQLWDVTGSPRRERSLVGLEPLPGQIEAIQSLAFSPDGQLLAASDKSEGSAIGHNIVSPVATLATWEVGSGTMINTPAELGAGAGMTASDVLAFSPDGRLLAASLLTGGVRVFDPTTGRVLRTLADPGNDTVSLAFAPTGDVLAAGTLGRDRRAVESGHSQAHRATAAGGLRGDRGHRVRSQRPAVRDHWPAGRHGEDLVHAQSRAGRSPPCRRSRRYRRDSIRTGRAGPARRRRSRRRLHLADVTDELGAARLLGRRSKPHAGRVGAVRCGTAVRNCLPLTTGRQSPTATSGGLALRGEPLEVAARIGEHAADDRPRER